MPKHAVGGTEPGFLSSTVNQIMFRQARERERERAKVREMMFYIYAISPLIGSNRFAHANIMT